MQEQHWELLETYQVSVGLWILGGPWGQAALTFRVLERFTLAGGLPAAVLTAAQLIVALLTVAAQSRLHQPHMLVFPNPLAV